MTQVKTPKAAATKATSYFDLTTYVDGFVSRIREIQGKKKSDRTMYCTISSPLGTQDANGKNQYTSYDVRVCGKAVLDYIAGIKADVDAGRKVVVRAVIGDIYGDAWLSKDDAGNDVARAGCKGRLVSVKPIPQGENMKQGSNTYGLGYLNNVRKVRIADNDELVASIAALRGEVTEPDITYFEALVSEAAMKAIELLQPNFAPVAEGEEKAKVLVGFELSNIATRPFIFSKGKSEGKAGTSMNSNLLSVRWAKVNGEQVEVPARIVANQATGTDGH